MYGEYTNTMAIPIYRVLPYPAVTVLFITTVHVYMLYYIITTQQNRIASLFGWCRIVQYISYTMLLIFTIVWQNGRSPLMMASQDGHVQVVTELLQHGAKVDLQDKVWSFLHWFFCLCGTLDLLCHDHSNNSPVTFFDTNIIHTCIHIRNMTQALESYFCYHICLVCNW